MFFLFSSAGLLLPLYSTLVFVHGMVFIAAIRLHGEILIINQPIIIY